MDVAIALKNVTKKFEDEDTHLLVLDDITLEIFLEEFFVFVGPSGAGKSTILRLMSGLETSYEGEIHFSPDITSADISFIFQQFALLPWLSVIENVELPLIARGVDKRERKERALSELKKLGLGASGHVYPRELSGGMRQRVGIARALVTNPKVVFMDEPFSELDSFTAEELRKEVLAIWEMSKPTIIMVTHLISEAIELADRIAVLTPVPAKIEKIVENKLARPRRKRTDEAYRMEDELYKLIKP